MWNGEYAMKSWMMQPVLLTLLVAGQAQAQNLAQNLAPSVTQESRNLPGLSQAGEIIIDRAGIPHIYAATARDGKYRRDL
jgi:penicillin amidase